MICEYSERAVVHSASILLAICHIACRKLPFSNCQKCVIIGKTSWKQNLNQEKRVASICVYRKLEAKKRNKKPITIAYLFIQYLKIFDFTLHYRSCGLRITDGKPFQGLTALNANDLSCNSILQSGNESESLAALVPTSIYSRTKPAKSSFIIRRIVCTLSSLMSNTTLTQLLSTCSAKDQIVSTNVKINETINRKSFLIFQRNGRLDSTRVGAVSCASF